MTPFDDAGAAVGAVDFDYDAVDGQPLECPARGDSAEAVGKLLSWCVAGRTAEQAGRRAILLGTLFRLPGSPRTCAQLAGVLGLSRQRCHRLLTGIRDELARNRGFV
jgi:hypothetical protein